MRKEYISEIISRIDKLSDNQLLYLLTFIKKMFS